MCHLHPSSHGCNTPLPDSTCPKHLLLQLQLRTCQLHRRPGAFLPLSRQPPPHYCRNTNTLLISWSGSNSNSPPDVCCVQTTKKTRSKPKPNPGPKPAPKACGNEKDRA